MICDKNLANAVGGKTARACDCCIRKRARWYCAADDAFLCEACDSSVHSANPLARRHGRVRLKTSSSKSSDGDTAVPSWHRGFTRKARTPRHRKPLNHQTPKSEEDQSVRNPSLAILNTHVCTATSLLTWIILDTFFGKPSVIGAVQGMITGLVCITPAAGVVQGWAAILMGLISGSIPWYTMMVLHKKVNFLRQVDDPMAVFHTHAVAGSLGGILTGFLAVPTLCRLFYMVPDWEKYIGLAYGLQNGRTSAGLRQMGIQLGGILFVVCLNVVTTSLICLLIRFIVPLRLDDDELQIGDNAIHGEEAFALQADQRERFLNPKINKVFDAQEFSSTASSFIGELQMV